MFHWSVKLDSDVPVIYFVGIRWICCSPTVLVFCQGTDCWLPPALDGNQCIDRSDLSSGQTMKYSFAHVPWTQESFQSSRWCWRSSQGGFCSINFLNQRLPAEHFSFPVFSASIKTYQNFQKRRTIHKQSFKVCSFKQLTCVPLDWKCWGKPPPLARSLISPQCLSAGKLAILTILAVNFMASVKQLKDSWIRMHVSCCLESEHRV